LSEKEHDLLSSPEEAYLNEEQEEQRNTHVIRPRPINPMIPLLPPVVLSVRASYGGFHGDPENEHGGISHVEQTLSTDREDNEERTKREEERE
jgi:hypothetical protein